MSYKQAIKDALTLLGKDPLTRFVGYGMLAGRAGGFLTDVPESSIVEMPVAENLMTGVAMGLSLSGLRPVLTYERADFLWCGMDAIRNHIDVAARISRGEFRPAVIIRVVIGNRNKPLFTGLTHTSDPSEGLRSILDMPILCPRVSDEVTAAYEFASKRQSGGGSTMVFERKDNY